MLKGRFEAKLNRKAATFLAVLCLVGTLSFGVIWGSPDHTSNYTSGDTESLLASQSTNAQSITIDQGANSDSLMPQDSDLGFDVALDVMIKLTIVIVLIVALTKVLQHMNRRSRLPVGGRSSISVVESLGLAQNQMLYLIEVGEKAILVGATATQLSTLTEITDPTVLASIRTRAKEEETPQNSFASYLQRFGSEPWSEPRAMAMASALQTAVQEAVGVVRKITNRPEQAASAFSTAEDHGTAIH